MNKITSKCVCVHGSLRLEEAGSPIAETSCIENGDKVRSCSTQQDIGLISFNSSFGHYFYKHD